MNLFTSPLCGLCNYQIEQNEPVKTHSCTQKFHEKCWTPFYDRCSYCLHPAQITPLALNLEQLVEDVSNKRFGGNLTQNHLSSIQMWLTQYENSELNLKAFLCLILDDLLNEAHPIKAASRHAAFFDILFAIKALKERDPNHLLDEGQIKSQLKEKEIKQGIEFLRSYGDGWIQSYLEVLQALKLRSPYPHRLIESDKRVFRLIHRFNFLSERNSESYNQLMQMSEQELLVLKDQPELRHLVQKHLEGHRTFQFFMRCTAMMIYSMILVIIGSMLKGNEKS